MGKKYSNTPSGDRQRHRAAQRAKVAQPMAGNRLRVRSKRLDQVDEDKLSLAFWLLAKQLVEDQTEPVEPATPASSDRDAASDEVAS